MARLISVLSLVPTLALSAVAASSPPACNGAIMPMMHCASYVGKGSNEGKPDANCCKGVSNVMKISPSCLCDALEEAIRMDIDVDLKRARRLPTVCLVNVEAGIVGLRHRPSHQHRLSSPPSSSGSRLRLRLRLPVRLASSTARASQPSEGHPDLPFSLGPPSPPPVPPSKTADDYRRQSPGSAVASRLHLLIRLCLRLCLRLRLQLSSPPSASAPSPPPGFGAGIAAPLSRCPQNGEAGSVREEDGHVLHCV